jgi:hypothetical protein
VTRRDGPASAKHGRCGVFSKAEATREHSPVMIEHITPAIFSSATGALAVLLLAAGCSSRVDLADERASGSAAAGAPAASDSGSGAEGGTSSSGGTGGAGTGGSMHHHPSTGGTGGTSGAAIACCSVLEFRAQSDASGAPVYLDPGTERMDCFGYHVSTTEPSLFLAFGVLIDNELMLHGLEFVKVDEPQVNGSYHVCSNSEPAGEQLYHWAPGTGPLTLPAGSEIPIGAGDFQLRVHYINATDQVLRDSSGVGACVCPE